MRTLNQAKPGEKIVVERINGSGPVKRRIMDMALKK